MLLGFVHPDPFAQNMFSLPLELLLILADRVVASLLSRSLL